MADCEAFGLDAGGHHLTSVALHAVAAVLLFAAFRRLTGDVWGSGFLAAAFALHPLRVESVAWVAERKDVLSGVLFGATLLAYARYATAPSAWRYAAVAVCLTLGLMSKPMLVTVPCVLLLLDYWPLRRFGGVTGVWLGRVLGEKIPLLALAAGSSVATLLAQSSGAAVVDLGTLAFDLRLKNAIVSYVVYVSQTVWPFDLAVFYPYPGAGLTDGIVTGAAAILVLATGGAWVLRRRRPAVLVGWLWYLGMLVPVIGLVQVGQQGHADRYTYLPQLGLWVALVWGVPWRSVLGIWSLWACALSVLVVWGAQSGRQAGYWRDSETLYRHSLASAGPSFQVLANLGMGLAAQERWADSAEYLRRAIEINSDDQLRFVYGLALVHLERDSEAADQFKMAYMLNPSRIDARTNLVMVYSRAGDRFVREGRLGEAMAQYEAALVVDPSDPTARKNKAIIYYNRGLAAGQNGRLADAAAAFREALLTDPTLGVAHTGLGVALLELGDFAAAADAFRNALRIDPTDAVAKVNLTRLLSRPKP
jgi:tetratricopeptide (TPR) repeat protein